MPAALISRSWTQKGKRQTGEHLTRRKSKERTSDWMNQLKTASTYNSPKPGGLAINVVFFFLTTPPLQFLLYSREKLLVHPSPPSLPFRCSLRYLLLLFSFLGLFRFPSFHFSFNFDTQDKQSVCRQYDWAVKMGDGKQRRWGGEGGGCCRPVHLISLYGDMGEGLWIVG